MSDNKKKLSKLVGLGVIGVAVAGGLAFGFGLSASAGVLPFGPAAAAPEYATNAAGETYGTAVQARTPDEEPDLILAVATNGETGYVRGSELYGDLDALRTVEDNIAYTQAQDAAGVRTINVYKSDGVTIVGVFEVGGGETTTQERYLGKWAATARTSRPGGRWRLTSERAGSNRPGRSLMKPP